MRRNWIMPMGWSILTFCVLLLSFCTLFYLSRPRPPWITVPGMLRASFLLGCVLCPFTVVCMIYCPPEGDAGAGMGTGQLIFQGACVGYMCANVVATGLFAIVTQPKPSGFKRAAGWLFGAGKEERRKAGG
jgi:hypothetical protein